jgi:succinate-acetate transporter protein
MKHVTILISTFVKKKTLCSANFMTKGCFWKGLYSYIVEFCLNIVSLEDKQTTWEDIFGHFVIERKIFILTVVYHF